MFYFHLDLFLQFMFIPDLFSDKTVVDYVDFFIIIDFYFLHTLLS